MPFDDSSVHGKFTFVFWQSFFMTIYFIFYTIQLTIFIGMVSYLEAFINDFKQLFDEFDDLWLTPINSWERSVKANELLYDVFNFKMIITR